MFIKTKCNIEICEFIFLKMNDIKHKRYSFIE